MKTLFKIRPMDPGKHQDSFAMLELIVDIQKKTTLINGAFGWQGEDYPKVESDINTIHKEDPADFYVCEKNNTGTHVIDSLKSIYGIPITAITTSNDIKSDKVISKGATMDKSDIVKTVKTMKKAGALLITKNKTPHMKKFIRQLNSFVKKQTKAGKITYGAEGQEHDDYVMAFLIGMHFIVHNFLKQYQKRQTMSKKHSRDIYRNEVGSGIPEGARLIGRNIIYPGGSGGMGQFPQFRKK